MTGSRSYMGDPTDSALILEFARSHAPQDPHAFRFEPQTYTLRTERGGRALIEVDWSAALLADIEAHYRLRLRKDDQLFFERDILAPGAFAKLESAKAESETQRNLRANAIA